DGGEALPAIARELEAARSHVHITGWFFSPGFALVRAERLVVLRHLLAELAERVDVRVLVWAGAPLPLFRPSRREVARMRDELTKQTRIKCSRRARAAASLPPREDDRHRRSRRLRRRDRPHLAGRRSLRR